jgi:hypothetical protein
VLDVAACEENLGVRTVLDDLSVDGFSLQMAYPVKKGEKLLVITQISQAVLMLRGEVVEVEEEESGVYRLSVSITQHQIFSSLATNPSLERISVENPTLTGSRLSEVPLGYGTSS